MRVASYKNFDELFYHFNRDALLNPKEYIESTRQTIGYINDLVFRCSSYDCSLNMGDFGFKKQKFLRAVCDLVDKYKLKEFYKELKTNSKCCIFHFKETCGTMVCIVLKRCDNRSKFSSCDVFFKNADLQKDFAVNLIFLNRFLTELPDTCDVKDITLFISQGTFSAQYINGYLEYFDLGYAELDTEHPFIKTMIGIKNNHFTDKTKISNYNTLRRMQELYFDLYEFPVVRVDELSIGVKDD